MTETRDPPRLREAGDPAFAELMPGMAEVQLEGPALEQLARMRAVLQLPPLPESPSAPELSAMPATPAASWVARRLIAKLVLVGALAAGTLFGLTRAVERAPERAPAAVARPRAIEAAPAPPPQPPSLALAEAPVVPSEPSAAPAPKPVSSQRARPRTAQASDAATAAELELLKRARADVRFDPAHALALTEEHAARFEHGALAEEREVIAIEALLSAKRVHATQRRAQAFFTRFPGSAHARRVRKLLAEHAVALSDTESAPP